MKSWNVLNFLDSKGFSAFKHVSFLPDQLLFGNYDPALLPNASGYKLDFFIGNKCPLSSPGLNNVCEGD